MSLSGFSGDGSRFLQVSRDNRLHRWEVSRGEERCYVEKQHLSHSYLCFSWSEKKELGLAAVGTSDGLVIIWDLARGVVARTIRRNESSSPTDLKFSMDLQSIFCSSSGNEITEYEVKTGEVKRVLKGFKKGTQKLAVGPNVVAAASGTIKLISLKSEKKQKLDSKFAKSGVSVMAISSCGQYLVCAGAGSKEIVLFYIGEFHSTSNTEEKIKPVCVYPVKNNPCHLSLKVNKKDKESKFQTIDILCVMEGSEGGCILRVKIVEHSSPSVDIGSINGCDASDNSMINGCFASASGSVVLALGQESLPKFIAIPYLDSSGSLLSSIDIPPTVTSSNEESYKDDVADGVSQEAMILGPHENGGVKRPLVDDLSEEQSKRTKHADHDTAVDKLTIEERLNNTANSLLKLEGLSSDTALGNGTASQPTTDSLVSLVEQALQANDDGMLEQCLECADKDVVTETAKRLPTKLVVPLLKKLVAKFEKKPSRGVLLTRWIHGLLRFHTSFLLSVPDLSRQLAALSQMLEQRLSTYSRLASLAGRLDLLMSQVSSASPVQYSERTTQDVVIPTSCATFEM